MKMTKIRIGLALGLAAGAGAAHAQSSVTLYGLIDDGLTYATNAAGHGQALQQSGEMRGNRWGLRALEDLGGGLKAVAVLEDGFTNENGAFAQGGLEFGRQAYVGLQNQFGTIALGRQYDFVVDYVGGSFSSALYNTAYAFHLGDLDRLSGQRADSAIKFYSADLSGFNFGAMYAIGDGQGTPAASGRTVSFGAHYHYGNFAAGAAYTAEYSYPLALAGIFGTTSIFGQTVGTVSGGVITAKNINVDRTVARTAGVSYVWGNFLALGLFTDTSIKFGGSSGDFLTYEGTGVYNFTSALSLAGSYTYETFQGMKYGMIATTLDERLSKRTDVYATIVNLRGYSGGKTQIHSIATSSSNAQTIFRVGLRVLF